MALVVMGLNHTTADVSVREKFSFDKETSVEIMERVSAAGEISEILVVSTCNRTELYFRSKCLAKDKKHLSEIIDSVCPGAGSTLFLDDIIYTYSDGDAILHLLKVCSGLDSMIMGETQILGQIKDAYSTSNTKGCCGHVFHKLFHHAFKVAKKVRTETKIGEGIVSVGAAAVEVAVKHFDDCKNIKTLLVGAGDAALTVGKHLRKKGFGEIVVVNRTFENAIKLSEEIEAKALEIKELKNILKDVGLVISSTGSTDFAITREMFGDAVCSPLLLVDIAVPRDIDPTIGDIDDITLCDMDSINEIVATNVKKRELEVPKAMEIVKAEKDSFLSWVASPHHQALIRDFCKKFDGIRKIELKKHLSRFHKDDHDEIEQFSKSLIKKLIHSPLLRMKENQKFSEEAHMETIRELFQLSDQ